MAEKEPNIGEVPCLSCGKKCEYLHSNHFGSTKCKTGEGLPTGIDAYREWAAGKFGIDRDDPIFETNQIQKPQYYHEHAERLAESGVELPT